MDVRIEDIEANVSALVDEQGGTDAEERVSRADLEQERGYLIRDRANLSKDAKETLDLLARFEPDKAVVDHLSAASPADLRSWARDYLPHTEESADFKRLMLLHADWEIRFGRNREFKAALVAASNVVAGTCLGVMSIPGSQEVTYDLCIVDEASIATPTEVLVPMSRSRRAILVGDSKQLSPFEDPDLANEGMLERFNLTREDQKRTLFKHLAERLPSTLTKMLRTQHRMVRPIGQLISECFYDGALRTEKADTPNRLQGVLKRRVIWRSTSRLPDRASHKRGRSYICEAEIGEVLRILDRVSKEIKKDRGETIEIAVLTGYNAQKERLLEAIEPRLSEWPEIKKLSVSSIDAFQGREADMAIFSVSRSDVGGLGFLKEMERINVALSRAREYLVIVGDSLFCMGVKGSPNPLKAVLEYIRAHSDDAAIEGLVS
jgi:superfamily I DNA and/or RNA helicase